MATESVSSLLADLATAFFLAGAAVTGADWKTGTAIGAFLTAGAFFLAAALAGALSAFSAGASTGGPAGRPAARRRGLDSGVTSLSDMKVVSYRTTPMPKHRSCVHSRPRAHKPM